MDVDARDRETGVPHHDDNPPADILVGKTVVIYLDVRGHGRFLELHAGEKLGTSIVIKTQIAYGALSVDALPKLAPIRAAHVDKKILKNDVVDGDVVRCIDVDAHGVDVACLRSPVRSGLDNSIASAVYVNELAARQVDSAAAGVVGDSRHADLGVRFE